MTEKKSGGTRQEERWEEAVQEHDAGRENGSGERAQDEKELKKYFFIQKFAQSIAMKHFCPVKIESSHGLSRLRAACEIQRPKRSDKTARKQ